MKSLLAALLLAAPALADGTIVVLGHGEARVRPDRLILTFRVASSAEKAADAVAKQKEKVGKVKEALVAAAKERKLEGARVEAGGLEFGAPPNSEEIMIMGGGGQQSEEVHVGTNVTLEVEGVDALDEAVLLEQIAVVVDVAVDAGAAYSGGPVAAWAEEGAPPATVAFGFSDEEGARAKALDAAVADARARAAELARRFGRQVGDPVKIEDLSLSDPESVDADALAAAEGKRRVSVATGAAIRAAVRVEFGLK